MWEGNTGSGRIRYARWVLFFHLRAVSDPPMYRQPDEVTRSARQGSVSPPSLFRAIRTFCTIHHHLHPFRATGRFRTITTTTRFAPRGGFDPPTFTRFRHHLHSFQATRRFRILTTTLFGISTPSTTIISTRFEQRGGSASTTTTSRFE